MHIHDDSHEVRHISELDRRRFLKTTGVVTGLAFLSNLLETSQASSAATISLPGFAAFSKSVKISKNSKYYLVESSGLPDHQMMVGIKSWQQQVPITQPYTGTNSWIPNWNSPSYLNRWRALQQAAYDYIMNYTIVPSSGPWAGKTVRGRDILDWADLRGYGNFGEWHTWPWTQNQPANAVLTDSSYVKIVNATKDIWKNVPLHINVAVFDANSWADHNPFRAWYALTKRNDWGLMGYRDDGIGDFGKWFLSTNPWTYGNWRADTALLNRWKYSLNTGEPLNGTSTCCPLYYDIRNQLLNVSHYATFGNGNYGSNSQQTFDTIRAVFKLAGFRYNLNGGYMSTTLAQNANFNVSLNWRNVGNAPIYQKRWRVVYQLKTAADVEVKK